MLGRSFRLVLHYSAETKAEPRAARSEGAGDPGMRRIVEKHGADSNAADPVRVLRVPGFYHCKGKRALVRLTKCGGRRYTTAELVKAFPPIKRARPNRSRVATSDTVDQGALQSALEHLAATQHPHSRHSEGTYVDHYDTWVRFGLAIKRALGEDGFATWDEWSRFSDRYPGEESSRAKWDALDVDGRSADNAVHVGTVFHTAKRQGWSFIAFQQKAH